MRYGVYTIVAGYVACGFSFHFLHDPQHYYINMPKWCRRALIALFGLGLVAMVVGVLMAVFLP